MRALIETVRDAWAGLAARPWRSGISFGTVAVGALALSLLLGVLEGLRDRIERVTRELGVGTIALLSPESGTSEEAPPMALSRDHRTRIQANLPRALSSGVRFAQAQAPDGSHLRIVVTDEHLARVRGWRLREGRFLDGADVTGGARSIVATESQAKAAGWRVGDLLHLDGLLFRLAGIVQVDEGGLSASDAGGRLAMGDRTVFRTALSPEEDQRLDILFIRVPPEQAHRDWPRIRRLTEQPDFGADPPHWVTPGTLTAGLRRMESAVRAVSAAGTALALLLGSALLSGLWMAQVRERIPEIGIRRALGAGRHAVGALFLTEGLLIGAAAGLVGTVLAQGVVYGFSAGPEGSLPLLPGGLGLWLPPVAACGAGALFAWAPARLASRIEPAAAVRAE